MNNNKEIIVIIPAYNEEKHIKDLSVKIINMGYDILVIDDHSTDNTAGIAASAGAIVIKHSANMGYGVALQTGYKYANEKHYKYLVQLDGDGQHDPKYIEKVVQPVLNSEADICIGSRFLGEKEYIPPLIRKIGINFFRTMLKVMTGKDIADPTSGYQAMNRKIFNYLSTDVFPDDYPDADVIYLLSSAGAIIKEVPITMNYNTEKSMHSNVINNIYYVLKINLLLLSYTFKKINKL